MDSTFVGATTQWHLPFDVEANQSKMKDLICWALMMWLRQQGFVAIASLALNLLAANHSHIKLLAGLSNVPEDYLLMSIDHFPFYCHRDHRFQSRHFDYGCDHHHHLKDALTYRYRCALFLFYKRHYRRRRRRRRHFWNHYQTQSYDYFAHFDATSRMST